MRREGCPKKIVYSGNVKIRRFKGREGRGLIVGMIGKLEIDIRDRLWAKGNRVVRGILNYLNRSDV